MKGQEEKKQEGRTVSEEDKNKEVKKKKTGRKDRKGKFRM